MRTDLMKDYIEEVINNLRVIIVDAEAEIEEISGMIVDEATRNPAKMDAGFIARKAVDLQRKQSRVAGLKSKLWTLEGVLRVGAKEED